MSTLILLTAVLFPGVPGDTPREELQQEKARLQGEWVVVGAEQGGKKLSPDERKKLSEVLLTKVVFEGDRVTYWLQAKDDEPRSLDATEYTLDLATKPRTIRLGNGVVIYSLDGDMLKVCLRFEKATEAPKSFDTKDDPEAYLFEFKRVPKK